jgi:hypothetical protein
MLFGETVAVYCEDHTEHINTLCGHFSSYLTGNTLRLRSRAQPRLCREWINACSWYTIVQQYIIYLVLTAINFGLLHNHRTSQREVCVSCLSCNSRSICYCVSVLQLYRVYYSRRQAAGTLLFPARCLLTLICSLSHSASFNFPPPALRRFTILYTNINPSAKINYILLVYPQSKRSSCKAIPVTGHGGL